jgi:hypothetical protein
MKKVFNMFLIIAGGLIISSCASLFQEPTPFQQYPYASDGDAYIVPNGRLVHRSLRCPNIQSTSGYKRVSSSDGYKYGYSICSDCLLMR